ncbi:hypothetical protein H0Z60_12320 [Ectothiorhodospiraceae bacterium WFHF3C12]|nr:hypothetical protein [Ectothiorhodospiraceae bacterium WFHF3C12]
MSQGTPMMPDEDMRGFIGLPDYQAEVTVSQCDLVALPAGVESAATEIAPSVLRRGDQFLRWTYVTDEPQRIRETWVG